MVKSYACAGILLFAIGLFPLMAQDNTVAKEMAIKIADRIIASTEIGRASCRERV